MYVQSRSAANSHELYQFRHNQVCSVNTSLLLTSLSVYFHFNGLDAYISILGVVLEGSDEKIQGIRHHLHYIKIWTNSELTIDLL